VARAPAAASRLFGTLASPVDKSPQECGDGRLRVRATHKVESESLFYFLDAVVEHGTGALGAIEIGLLLPPS